VHVLVYLPLIAPALAALAARPLAGWLPPATATWLLTGGAVVLASASTAMLGLLALAAVIRLPGIAAAGGLSLEVVRRTDPAPWPLGAAAGLALTVAGLALARAARRRGDALVTAHREARRLAGRDQVVVLADARADAYATPGWPGRIVVTSGMLDALSPPERAVLLAHEHAHASGRHYLFTAAVRVAAAANPLLLPLSSAVSYSVERWADEHAATVVGDRRLAARAVARAALAAAAAPSALRPAALPGVVSGAGIRPGAVPRRVTALLAAPPRRRLGLVVLAVALLVLCGGAALDAATDLHAFVEFAQAGLAG